MDGNARSNVWVRLAKQLVGVVVMVASDCLGMLGLLLEFRRLVA